MIDKTSNQYNSAISNQPTTDPLSTKMKEGLMDQYMRNTQANQVMAPVGQALDFFHNTYRGGKTSPAGAISALANPAENKQVGNMIGWMGKQDGGQTDILKLKKAENLEKKAQRNYDLKIEKFHNSQEKELADGIKRIQKQGQADVETYNKLASALKNGSYMAVINHASTIAKSIGSESGRLSDDDIKRALPAHWGLTLSKIKTYFSSNPDPQQVPEKYLAALKILAQQAALGVQEAYKSRLNSERSVNALRPTMSRLFENENSAGYSMYNKASKDLLKGFDLGFKKDKAKKKQPAKTEKSKEELRKILMGG